MVEDSCTVQWDVGQAVVALPEHIGASNAGQVRDTLLSVINLGAATVIADMTATVSCDHAGADAVVRAWQRTVSSGTELRLVVTAGSISRVLGLRGLDRQVSVYPSLQAARAARRPLGSGAVPIPAGGLLEGLRDAVALADGGVIVSANTRLEDMFGDGHRELSGLATECLVPEGLQEPHEGHWAVWGRPPSARPAAIPDVTCIGRLDELAVLAQDAAAAQRGHLRLLDAVVTGLFHAGLSLQAAQGLPADAARRRTAEVASELDDIIGQIRVAAFAEPRAGASGSGNQPSCD